MDKFSSLEENIRWLDAFIGTLADDVEGENVFDSLYDSPTSPLEVDTLYGSTANEDEEQIRFEENAEDNTGDGDDTEHSSDSRKELEDLLETREKITNLLKTNEAFMGSLKKTISQIRSTIEEVNKFQTYLNRSDDVYQYCQSGASIPLNKQSVKLPMFPNIYQEIPRIAYEAKEVEDLRIYSSKFEWSEKDAINLQNIIMKHCKKEATIRLAKEGKRYDDIVMIISSMSDEQLAKFSLPDNVDHEPIDWVLVSHQLGGTHTPEDCRTRWFMIQRPGINRESWSPEELINLKSIIERCQVDGMVKDWITISQKVGNGRTAIDCFSACQKKGMLKLFAHTLPTSWTKFGIVENEAKEIERLFGIWDNRTVIIHERLGTSRPKSIISTRVNRLQSNLVKAPETWLVESDIELVRHLAKSLKFTRPHILREPWRVEGIDWESDFPMKPRNVTGSDVRERWQKIVKDSRVHPQKYVSSTKRDVEAVADNISTTSKRPRGRPRKQ